MKNMLIFLIMVAASIFIDIAWFTLFAGPYYSDALNSLLRQTESGFTLNITAAVIVYMLLILGIMLFVMPRGFRSNGKAAWWGALYGFILYGVYDFTNYATLSNWPIHITMIDVCWGTVFCAILSMITAFLKRRWHC